MANALARAPREAAAPQIPRAQRVHANAGQTRRAHCDGAPVHYQRHRSEQSTLYRLVLQHAQSFFAQSEETTGASLPQFVKDEFDAFLECGILAHGFAHRRGAAGAAAQDHHPADEAADAPRRAR